MKWQDIQALVALPGQQPDFKACLTAFPALERAMETPQGEHHREGDVWTHTKMVVEALVAHPEYASLSVQDRTVVFLAALLHDVAKYSTTVIDPDSGKISQPGHSKRGAVDARIALWDAGAPFVLREAICRLIAVHQAPFYAIEGHRGKTPEFLVRELSWQLSIPLLALVAEADMRGRICDDQQSILDSIELFRELARGECCYGAPRAFSSPHTAVAYFRGANVHPDYELFQEPGSPVVVMCGLPASGKDTWVSEHYPGLPVVSFDDARAELGLRHGKNEGLVAHHAVDKAKGLLRDRAPFVWNATHLSEQMRSKTLSLLYGYHATVHLVYLEARRQELLERNRKRDTSLTNKALEGMLFKWEVPVPSEAHQVTFLP